MTYRDSIKGEIQKLNTLYIESKKLLRIASKEERAAWIIYRQYLFNAMGILIRLDKELTDNRAQMDLTK